MHDVDISVVIPVYNRTDELRKSLQSLTYQTLPANRFEVIIADDGSAEDVRSVLNEFPHLQIKYAHQPDEGFRAAAARNLGADQATGKILVYNDNGMLLSSNTLEKYISYYKANGEAFVVLANMFATGWGTDEDRAREILDSNTPDKAIAIMKEEGMNDGRGYMFSDFGYDVESWYIPWNALWGGHFSVHAAFVKKHNIRWNESFTSWGGEDNEYGIQLCEAGARLCFCHDVEVVHYPTPNSKAITGPDDEFRKNYEKTKQLILSLHPTREVEAWSIIGGGANHPEKRAELFKQKGWTE